MQDYRQKLRHLYNSTLQLLGWQCERKLNNYFILNTVYELDLIIPNKHLTWFAFLYYVNTQALLCPNVMTWIWHDLCMNQNFKVLVTNVYHGWKVPLSLTVKLLDLKSNVLHVTCSCMIDLINLFSDFSKSSLQDLLLSNGTFWCWFIVLNERNYLLSCCNIVIP